MLTERGTGLLISAALLWVGARSLGVPELQVAAVACLALLGLAVLFVLTTSARLRVERTVRPARLFYDAHAQVRLRLVNAGRLPTATLEVRDTVPPALAGEPRALLAPVRPAGRAEVVYELRGRQRGRFELGPVTIRLRDPFGLVARRRQAGTPGTVVVYPPVWALPEGVPLGGATTTGGEGRPRPHAGGEDLANVREYVRGDDLRTVHWPTTAHRGKLMVRQAEAPQDPRALLLLDVRADRHRGHGPAASFETAVAAAASITYHLASHGRQVVLLEQPFATPPRARPWQAWLERLAELEPTAVDLEGLLRQVARGSAGEGALVAVLTAPDAAELRSLVRAGRAFTTRSAVLVDAASHGPARSRARSDRVPAGAEVAATADALRVAGWRVTVVRAGDRLDERWRDLARAQRVPTGAAAPGDGRRAP